MTPFHWKKTERFRLYQRGFTLLELMLTLGGITVLGAGTFAGYQIYEHRQHVTQTVAQVRHLSNQLMQTYGQTGGFAKVSTDAVIHGNLAEPSMVKANGLQHPFGGAMGVEPTGDGQQLKVSLHELPQSACVQLSSNLYKDFQRIDINDAPLSKGERGFNIQEVGQLCRPGQNQVAFISAPVGSDVQTGEVSMPVDRGATSHSPAPSAPEVKSVDAAGVTAVDYGTYTPPTLAVLPDPKASNGSPVTSGVSVNTPSTASTPPPATALPPQSCFPSVTKTPSDAWHYESQTLGCQAGYLGAVQQQRQWLHTTTQVKTVTCDTLWATPKVTNTVEESDGTKSDWTTTNNSCQPQCVAPAPTSYNNYNWVGVNAGCPSGYTGAHTYEVQQAQTVTTTYSCPQPTGNYTSSTNVGGWWNTGATRNDNNTCQAANGKWVETGRSAGYSVEQDGYNTDATYCNGYANNWSPNGRFYDSCPTDSATGWGNNLYSAGKAAETNLNGCSVDIYNPGNRCQGRGWAMNGTGHPGSFSLGDSCTPGQYVVTFDLMLWIAQGQSGDLHDRAEAESRGATEYRCQ